MSKSQRKKDYKITRNKFFDTSERKAILETSETRALVDMKYGRKTWPIRYMLVSLALNTGLRSGEIANLKIKDLHLRGPSSYIFVLSGKGKKNRDVYIDQNLCKQLKQFLQDKKIWDESTDADAPLFTGRGGNHMTTTTLHISFKQAVREAKLRDDLTIHSARHSYATLLLHKTGNLRFVQHQLGHASINMTSLYADILPEENGRLANKLIEP